MEKINFVAADLPFAFDEVPRTRIETESRRPIAQTFRTVTDRAVVRERCAPWATTSGLSSQGLAIFDISTFFGASPPATVCSAPGVGSGISFKIYPGMNKRNVNEETQRKYHGEKEGDEPTTVVAIFLH